MTLAGICVSICDLRSSAMLSMPIVLDVLVDLACLWVMIVGNTGMMLGSCRERPRVLPDIAGAGC